MLGRSDRTDINGRPKKPDGTVVSSDGWINYHVILQKDIFKRSAHAIREDVVWVQVDGRRMNNWLDGRWR